MIYTLTFSQPIAGWLFSSVEAWTSRSPPPAKSRFSWFLLRRAVIKMMKGSSLDCRPLCFTQIHPIRSSLVSQCCYIFSMSMVPLGYIVVRFETLFGSRPSAPLPFQKENTSEKHKSLVSRSIQSAIQIYELLLCVHLGVVVRWAQTSIVSISGCFSLNDGALGLFNNLKYPAGNCRAVAPYRRARSARKYRLPHFVVSLHF